LARTFKTEAGLTQWITDELRLDPVCRSVAFQPAFNKYQVNSPNECNWGLGLLRDADDWPTACRRLLLKVVATAQRQFNLEVNE